MVVAVMDQTTSVQVMGINGFTLLFVLMWNLKNS